MKQSYQKASKFCDEVNYEDTSDMAGNRNILTDQYT